jgi:hypothetical protein
MDPSTERSVPWNGLSLFVLLGTLAGQLLYLLRDDRVPRDPGLYYERLPEAFSWIGSPVADFASVLPLLAESTGWYNLVAGACLHIFGRSPEVFRALDVLWVGGVLGGAWWLARHLSGAAGGFAAIALVASMPMVVLSGRTGWIHIPEAALVLAVVVTWARDPGMEGRATLGAMALLGAMAITLRPSGATWLAGMIPALGLWFLRGGRWKTSRPCLVWLSWGLALCVPLRGLGRYVEAKLGARARYLEHLGDLGQQLTWVFGEGVMALLGLGLALFLWKRSRPPSEVIVPLVAWVFLAGGLWVLFRPGLDNFPLLGIGLAVLAGGGFGRARPLGALMPGIYWVFFFLPQWLSPSIVRQHPVLQIATPLGASTNLLNHYRPWTGFGREDVLQLLAATCPSFATGATCRILVHQGLFQPFGEEPGALELFLLELDTVEILDVRDLPPGIESYPLHGAVEFRNCGRQEAHWRSRFPSAAQDFSQLVQAKGMVPVWSRLLDRECRATWLAPQGRLAAPGKLPNTGTRHADGGSALPEPVEIEAPTRPSVRPADIRKGRLPGGRTEAAGAGKEGR